MSEYIDDIVCTVDLTEWERSEIQDDMIRMRQRLFDVVSEDELRRYDNLISKLRVKS